MSLFQQTFNERVIPIANRLFGVTVTLRHGSLTSEPFVATWSDHEYEVVDAEGFLVKLHTRDFMFAAADAVHGGAALEPRTGDVLVMEEGGEQVKFEVLPIGRMPAAQLEPGGYRWRVHTKRMTNA